MNGPARIRPRSPKIATPPCRESRWGRHIRYYLAPRNGRKSDLSLEANRAIAALDKRRRADRRGQQSANPSRTRVTLPSFSSDRQSVSPFRI